MFDYYTYVFVSMCRFLPSNIHEKVRSMFSANKFKAKALANKQSKNRNTIIFAWSLAKTPSFFGFPALILIFFYFFFACLSWPTEVVGLRGGFKSSRWQGGRGNLWRHVSNYWFWFLFLEFAFSGAPTICGFLIAFFKFTFFCCCSFFWPFYTGIRIR